MDQRGILSTDFLLATLILLIIVSAIIGFVTTSIDSAKGTEFSKAKIVGEKVARSINMVHAQGPGDELNITLPGDFNYEISIINENGKSAVVVKYNNKESISYLVPNPNNVTDIGAITMKPNETYTIRNENGIIKIIKVI